MCLSICACGQEETKSSTTSKSSSSAVFSLKELVSDPEFQEAIREGDTENFKSSVSADSDTVLVYRVDAQKTYLEEDLDFFRYMSTEEISEKFDLEGLKKLLKNYGFGDITIEYKMYNGDGKLITERTIK